MSDASDRTIPATPRRREQARRAGMDPSSALPAWAASAATAILLAPAWARATIPAAAASFREAAKAGIRLEDISLHALPVVVMPTIGVVAASAAAGIAVRLACDGMSFQPGRAAFDPQRVNPFSGLGRIFSGATVLGMLGQAAALMAFGLVAVTVSRPLAATLQMPAEPGIVGSTAWRAVMWLAAASIALTVATWLLAKRRFEQRIKMTPAEYAEEAKDLQADPRVRLMQQQRKNRQPPASGMP